MGTLERGQAISSVSESTSSLLSSDRNNQKGKIFACEVSLSWQRKEEPVTEAIHIPANQGAEKGQEPDPVTHFSAQCGFPKQLPRATQPVGSSAQPVLKAARHPGRDSSYPISLACCHGSG